MALIFVGTPDVAPTYFTPNFDPHKGSFSGYHGYDSFLFSRKKKKPMNPEQKAARKGKRKTFWANLGKNIKQGGGAEGLGKTVDNIVNLFSKNTETPQDYTFELADSSPNSEKTGIPNSTLIIGGAVIVGLAGLGYMIYRNKKTG